MNAAEKLARADDLNREAQRLAWEAEAIEGKARHTESDFDRIARIADRMDEIITELRAINRTVPGTKEALATLRRAFPAPKWWQFWRAGWWR